MIRLAAFDLDGTLIGDEPSISPRVRQAIGAAQAYGGMVTLATGRMFDFLVPIAHSLNITLPLICYQGGMIRAADAPTPLYRATMDRSLMRDVLAWQAERDARLVLYAADDVFLTERRCSDEFYRFMLGERLRWVDDLAPVLEQHEPIKFVLLVEPEEAGRVQTELEGRFGERMAVTRSHEMIVEGNPAGVSKGDALRRLAVHLDIPQAEVMAVGDQLNDLTMLTWAGVGVAMGNAIPEVKRAADWIAPAVDEDGAAAAIERFVLAPAREKPLSP